MMMRKSLLVLGFLLATAGLQGCGSGGGGADGGSPMPTAEEQQKAQDMLKDMPKPGQTTTPATP